MVLNLKPATALVVLLMADPLSLTDAEQSRRTRLLDEQKGGTVDQLALDADFHRAVMMESSNSSAIGTDDHRNMLRGSGQTKETALEKFADQPNTQRLLVEGYPNCHVDMPSWIGDGICDGEEYNTEACGWDGGDCADPEEWIKYNGQACVFDGALYGNAVEGVDYKKWYNMDLKWCTNKCRKTRVPGTCKAYDFDTSTDRCRVYYTYPEDTKFKGGLTCWKNPMGCAWDGGVCDVSEEPTPTEEPTDEWWLTFEPSTEEPTPTEEPTDEWWLPPEEPTDSAEEPANNSEDGGSNRNDFGFDFDFDLGLGCDTIEGSPPSWAACISELNELRTTKASDVSQIYERPATCFITKVFYYYDEILREWYWTPYSLNDDLWISVDTLLVPSGFWEGQIPAPPNVGIITYLDKYNPDPRGECAETDVEHDEEAGNAAPVVTEGASITIVANSNANPSELTPCGGYLYYVADSGPGGAFPAIFRYYGSTKTNAQDSDSSSIEKISGGFLFFGQHEINYKHLACFMGDLYYYKYDAGIGLHLPSWHLMKYDGEEKFLYDTGDVAR